MDNEDWVSELMEALEIAHGAAEELEKKILAINKRMEMSLLLSESTGIKRGHNAETR